MNAAAFARTLSVGLSVLLIAAYGLGLLFSLGTHREFFGSAEHAGSDEAPWPLGPALGTLAGVTVLIALVSEVFVESVQVASQVPGMSAAFVRSRVTFAVPEFLARRPARGRRRAETAARNGANLVYTEPETWARIFRHPARACAAIGSR
jgi:hypothetical protein